MSLTTSGTQTPAQEHEREEAIAVALAQPHRQPIITDDGHVICAGEDRRLENIFGRWCLGHRPYPLADHLYDAGIRYAEVVREEKQARGFNVVARSYGEAYYSGLTQEQIEARKDLAISRRKAADEVLSPIKVRLPQRMESLVYDELWPSPNDEGVLIAGLVALSRKFGFAPRSIRES